MSLRKLMKKQEQNQEKKQETPKGRFFDLVNNKTKTESTQEVITKPIQKEMRSMRDLVSKDTNPHVEPLKQLMSDQEKELQAMYESNLLNPALNRFGKELSEAVSSYIIWLKAQNSSLFNTFNVHEVFNYYMQNVKKPVVVEFALKHNPENTLAAIFENVISAFENQADFAKAVMVYPVVLTKKYDKEVYFSPNVPKPIKRDTPSDGQVSLISRDYGTYTLKPSDVYKITKSEAASLIGALLNKNILWDYESKKKDEDNKKSYYSTKGSKKKTK